MNNFNITQLKEFYFNKLIEDVIPFWTKYSIDWEHGGFNTFLDRKGNLVSRDKAGWIQGRGVWVYSYLYNNISKNEEYLKIAENGARFVKDYLIRKEDGRAYFLVTKEGKPLILRRYLFSEIFSILGLSEFAKASGNKDWYDLSLQLLDTVNEYKNKLPPKVDPETRPMIGHSFTMILINLFQSLRECGFDEPQYFTKLIDHQIKELFKYFVKPEMEVLLEHVGVNGEILEGPEGRCVNPGHIIETAWFIMAEGEYRNDEDLISKGCTLLDWALKIGWDSEYGGLLSFVDSEGFPPAQIEWDMKYWWPHTEAIYATLLAFKLTEREKYFDWFKKIHSYSWEKFSDEEYGEWFGYLNRDGSISSTLKGNHFKGIFHLPRCLIKTYELLKKMDEEEVL